MKKSLPWLAVGTAFLLVSNGRWIIPMAAWLAPVFLLRFFRAAKFLPGLIIGLAVFSLSSGLMLYGIIPPALGRMFFFLVFYYALVWLLPFLADRLLAGRAGGFRATLIFPSAAVLVEYLNALALGDWGSWAFTQPGLLPLQQILSLTGLWGMTFLIAWFGAAANWAWEGGWEWTKLRRGLGIFAGVFTAVLIYGGARLAIFPPRAQTVKIAGLAFSRDGGSPAAYLDGLFARTKSCAAAGAAVVVWPEAAVDLDPAQKDAFVARGRAAAREAGLYLLAGYYLNRPDFAHDRGINAEIFFGPDGRVLWEYTKAHPVPGSTDVPGDGTIPTTATPYGIIGSAICYDFDFPALLRKAGRKGVDIMLDPSWDWKAIDPIHSQMAAARAIENGFALVRCCPEGLSLAVDGQGRTLAAMDYFRTRDRIFFADVPTRGTRTLYSQSGDILAWLCAAFLLWAVVFGGKKKRGD